MDDATRALFEAAFRDRVVEGIGTFLTEPRDPELSEYRQHDFSIAQLEGTKPELKKEMLTAKMYNKFNKVADSLISSYQWELKREKQIPKNPKAYRALLMDILNIDEDDLVNVFVHHLTDELKNKKSR